MPLLPAAIGIVLNADQTQVLLIKRCDVPVWVLPGGGIEADEQPEKALIREIQEETGLLVQVMRKCAEYSPINRLAAFTTVFICHIQSGEMRLSNETADIAFFPIKKLPSSLFPPHAHWLQEALSHHTLIRRPLTEISYVKLCQYLMCHPWLMIRYAWTRLTKS
jgi:8-oxo-dGTP diphosphatase